MSMQDLNKGQHFLIDKEIIDKEIEISKITKRDRVIEIGAGKGNLTSEIIRKAKEVLAFEIDKRYEKELNELEGKNLKVVYDNALNHSWVGYTKIVSNIPYHVSEQIIKKAIKEEIKVLVLIVGENFKELLEKKESKIGIISNLFYKIEYIMKVDKRSFSPIPRVSSWLIKLERKKKLSEKNLFLASMLVRTGKLKNVIMYSLVERGKTKRESREIIKGLNIYQESLEKPIETISGDLLKRVIKELSIVFG